MIRPMRPDDVPACLGIAADCWGKSTAQAVGSDFGRAFLYVTEMSDRVIGMAGHAPSEVAYGVHTLCWVGVRSDQRGYGHGKALVERCLSDLRPVADAVLIATAVPEFYRSGWGFKPLGKVHCSDSPLTDLMMLAFPPLPQHLSAENETP